MASYDRQLNQLSRYMDRMGFQLPDLKPLTNVDPSEFRTSIQVGQMPKTIDNPRKAEMWLQALADAWRPYNPSIAQEFTVAMNVNREQNARWFQDHGFGGV